MAAALCAFTVLACGRSHRATAAAAPSASGAPFPVRIEDDLGRTVVVAAEPRRIVTLLPSHTEMVCALGVCDRLVGVDDFSDYPPQVTKLPKVGGMYDARLESVLGLAPDLVVGSEASPATTAMERSGLSVWAGSARTLEDVYAVMRAIGMLVGRGREAAELAEHLRADIDAEARRLEGLRRIRVYYELDSTPYAVGPGSFLGELVAKAGGDNVVPKGIGEYPKVSPEIVANADPEVVLGAHLESLEKRPGWERTTAVKTRRVFVLTPEERAVVVRPGPRLAEGLRVLSRKIHAEPVP